MNEKQAFYKWVKEFDGRDDFGYEQAWQAACEYKEAENKKLREALEFYAVNGLAKVEVVMKIDERLMKEFYINGNYAREALKEVGKE